MRTNIELDDDLLGEAMELTGLKTKRAVVHEALRQLVRSRRRTRISDWTGKVRFAEGFDYKKLREGA